MLPPSSESIALAPAAGAGIGKILADRLLAEPTFVDAMVSCAMNALKATRSFWTGKGETAQLVTEPDSKTQLQAFALILAHMEGEPIKRIIHQQVGAAAGFDLDAELRSNPALAEGLRRKLENVDWRKSGRNTKRVKPSEPEPASVPPDGIKP